MPPKAQDRGWSPPQGFPDGVRNIPQGQRCLCSSGSSARTRKPPEPGLEGICNPAGFSRAKTWSVAGQGTHPPTPEGTPGCPSQAAPTVLSFSCGFPWEILAQGSRNGLGEALHVPHSFSNHGKLLMRENILIFHHFELKKVVSAHQDGAVHPCVSLEGALPQEEPVLP